MALLLQHSIGGYAQYSLLAQALQHTIGISGSRAEEVDPKIFQQTHRQDVAIELVATTGSLAAHFGPFFLGPGVKAGF